MTKNTIYEPIDTNPDHYKIDNADFSTYMKDPKIHGFGQWMFANGYNLALPYVVRCKDCKYRSKEMYDYYDNPNNKVYVCQINDIAKNPDWFCADGERRADDADS